MKYGLVIGGRIPAWAFNLSFKFQFSPLKVPLGMDRLFLCPLDILNLILVCQSKPKYPMKCTKNTIVLFFAFFDGIGIGHQHHEHWQPSTFE